MAVKRWPFTGAGAGQRPDDNGQLRPYLHVAPELEAPTVAALPGPQVPELGTVDALLSGIRRAIGEEDALGEALTAVSRAARQDAEVLAQWSQGALGGPEGEAFAATHRRRLTDLASDLKRLHDRLIKDEAVDGDLREALHRLAAAVEIRENSTPGLPVRGRAHDGSR